MEGFLLSNTSLWCSAFFPLNGSGQTDGGFLQNLLFFVTFLSITATYTMNEEFLKWLFGKMLYSVGKNLIGLIKEVMMNLKTTHILAVMSILLSISVITTAAAAGPLGPNRQLSAGRGIMGLKMFIELNLSEPQKKEALNIFQAYETDRDTVRNSLQEARQNLSKVLQAETFNEGQVREVFRRASSIREDLFVRRAKTMAELKALLTPEQRELLKERKARRMERLKDRFQTWYQNNSQ